MGIAMLLLVACISIVFGLIFFPRFSRSKKNIITSTVILTIIVVLLTFLYLIPRYNMWAFQSAIQTKYPFFKAIQEKSPEDYQAYIVQVRTDMNLNSDLVKEDTAAFINSELAKYAQYATNKTLCDYAKIQLDFYNQIAAQYPGYVLIFEFPGKFKGKGDPATLDRLVNEAGKNIFQAKGDIIESALNNPQPGLTDADKQKAGQILQEAGAHLAMQYGKDPVIASLEYPDDPNTDKAKAAAIIITLYKLITSRNEDECGLIFKYSLSHQR